VKNDERTSKTTANISIVGISKMKTQRLGSSSSLETLLHNLNNTSENS
jgi:hypothetical protein